jgi:hypothetical protein
MPLIGHVCCGLCRGDEHVDLVYGGSGTIASEIFDWLNDIELLGITPAAEAPPRERAGDHVVVTLAPGEEGNALKAWLVRWRGREP